MKLLALAAAFVAVSIAAHPSPSQASPKEDDLPCPDSKATALALPRVRDAIANKREVTVIALGSSSTEGVRATDPAHSYPAVLQTTLSASLPTAHVAVLNRGVGGQDVAEELPRIERDVVGTHPTLVIWQVGANGAMKRMSPELFKRMLTTGVRRMQEAHIDVVLMDNQRAPAILASPDHVRFDQAMADVASATGAGLFSRGALMGQWSQAGFADDAFISEDGVHHNDRGYRCMAKALATAIFDGLALPTTVVTRR